MSILLESLRQSSDNQDKDIPGVGDSHFDDEMLSDEWLLAKLRLWKIICALLTLAFAISSIGWYLSYSQPPLSPSQQQVEPPKVNKIATEPETEESFGALEIKSSVERPSQESQSIVSKQPAKQKYEPKKVELPVVSKPLANTDPSASSQLQTKRNGNMKSTASQAEQRKLSTGSSGSVIDYESLTQQQQNEMPELEISSYAVSSNSNKSFVVLNGAFYGQGETIAPNLVLISIEKESIVVRYFDQLIRKKYGL